MLYIRSDNEPQCVLNNPEYTGKKILCLVAIVTVAIQLGKMENTQEGLR